jgi:hypothetical protein
MSGRVRDTRSAPAHRSLDGLILILERVAASRDADRERQSEQRQPAPAGELV